LADFFAPKFYADDTFDLTEHQVVGNTSGRFIVVDDLGLFANFLKVTTMTINSVRPFIRILQLTVAKSFWLNPLPIRPCWINLATDIGTDLCFSSSVSRSSLAVFLTAPCCLFVPAPTRKTKVKRKVIKITDNDKHFEKKGSE
jgi:hypothetical protein